MGRAKNYKRRFLEKHPICCFCGGQDPAEEIDHIPSRSCFDGNIWPEGFEFPACSTCNHSTSKNEQVVAFLSRSLTNPEFPARKEEVVKYGLGSRNNSPDAMLEFENTIRPISEELNVFEVGPEMGTVFEVVFQKWARAFFYLETKNILPIHADVAVRLITLHAIQTGVVSAGFFEGNERPLLRNGKDLSEQFGYIYRADMENKIYMFTVMFRRSFAAVMMVNLLEDK